MDKIQKICAYKTQKYKSSFQSDGGGVMGIERNIYRLSLPSMYREPEISEDSNYGMDWVFCYHGI